MRRALALVVWTLGCGPSVGSGDDDDGTTSRADETSTSAGSTVGTTAPQPTTVEPDPTIATGVDDEGTSSTSTTGGEDGFPDEGIFEEGADDLQIECDPWAQDCPEMEKCAPWANDGSHHWNSTKCTPVDPNPAVVGESCMVEGSGWSGIDHCDVAVLCWGVDPATNTGTCVPMCMGSEANPDCPEGRECWIGFDGTLILCLLPCDPLAPECGTDVCAFDAADGEFWCVPPVFVGETPYGEPCHDMPFTCGSESACVPAKHVTNCAEQECCTPLCDPAGATACPEGELGQVCVPFDGDPTLGFCGVPG